MGGYESGVVYHNGRPFRLDKGRYLHYTYFRKIKIKRLFPQEGKIDFKGLISKKPGFIFSIDLKE